MSHPDAAAFIRRILTAPRDSVARLVFADWLDETGVLTNALWAKYLRLRAEADISSSILRELLRDEAALVAPHLTAELTFSATLFVNDFPAYLDLLPGPNFTLDVRGFAVPRPVLNGVSFLTAMNLAGLPLGRSDGRTVVGMANPRHPEAVGPFESLLGAIVPVRVEEQDLPLAIDAAYHPTRVTRVDQQEPEVDEPAPAFDEGHLIGNSQRIRRFLEGLIAEARERCATGIEVMAYLSHYEIRRVESGRPLRWHTVGRELGRQIVQAARILPTRRLRIAVRPRPTFFGPGARIVFQQLDRTSHP